MVLAEKHAHPDQGVPLLYSMLWTSKLPLCSGLTGMVQMCAGACAIANRSVTCSRLVSLTSPICLLQGSTGLYVRPVANKQADGEAMHISLICVPKVTPVLATHTGNWWL